MKNHVMYDGPIVTLGGGTGTSHFGELLVKYGYDVGKWTPILPSTDDGGSSREFVEKGFISPGDCRRVIETMADPYLLGENLGGRFNFRYSPTHPTCPNRAVGNSIIMNMAKKLGWPRKPEAILDAIVEIRKSLGVKPNVMPVSLETACIFGHAESELRVNGEYSPVPGVICHERELDRWNDHKDYNPIICVHTDSEIEIHEGVRKAIRHRNGRPPVVIGLFGSFHGSLMAVLKAHGLAEEIHRMQAGGGKFVLVTNLMNNRETGFRTTADFVKEVCAQLDLPHIDAVFCSKSRIPKKTRERYRLAGERPVRNRDSRLVRPDGKFQGDYASVVDGKVVHNENLIRDLFAFLTYDKRQPKPQMEKARFRRH